MAQTGSGANLERLVDTLVSERAESEWVEFKVNMADPHEIGTYLSALSNGAALHGEPYGYVVWGVEDGCLATVGTVFAPEVTKKGGEDLVPWLARGLEPHRWFQFSAGEIDGARLVLLEVEAAQSRPTSFDGQRWIRIGSYRKKLSKYPATEEQLWSLLLNKARPRPPAKVHCSVAEVFELLDVASCMRLFGRHAGLDDASQVEFLEAQRLVSKGPDGQFEIRQHAALLFARELINFPGLGSKALRVLEYPALARTGSPTLDRTYGGGYAVEFESVYELLTTRSRVSEEIDGARRISTSSYAPLAMRELVANALIHQDLEIHGTGPLVEIFSNRIEISNPGVSLVDVDRMLDHPPQSRNEQLADTMYQLGFCEKRGSGIDKVVERVGELQHPPPRFRMTGDSLTVTVFDAIASPPMRKDDRIRAIYLHACLTFVNGDRLTNEAVRQRFGLSKGQASLASRYIRETMEAGLLARYDMQAGRRSMSYVPFWAGETR